MKTKMISFRCDIEDFEALNELSNGRTSWFLRLLVFFCCHCLDRSEFVSWYRFSLDQLKKKKLVLVDRD